jgi:membrane peptidoglycan carboxypeptidase
MQRRVRSQKPTRASKQKSRPLKAFLLSPLVKISAALMVIGAIAGGVVFLHYYNIYATIIDRRLSGEVFKDTAKIYATPYIVYLGQQLTPNDVILRLRRAGLEPRDRTPSEDNVYQFIPGDSGSSIIVSPDRLPDYRLNFGGTLVDGIQGVLTGFSLNQVELPAELVTNLFDDTREKRRLLEWEQLPPHLTDALVASEDQRFFRHFGIDLIRAGGAFMSTYIRSEDLQGASTLTMQLAGNFFLDRGDRTWKRKLPEIFMALILEQRLTKSEILTMYANEVYIGNRGSFAIHGFGEAASAYFGKEISELTISDTATLVGMLPAPSAYSPRRNMELALERRDIVLNEMYELDMINTTQLAEARLTEIQVAEMRVDESEAPYMVDYIRNQLLDDFSQEELINDGLKIYTTLDPDLQKAAVEAVALGIANADAQLELMGRGPSSGRPPVQASIIVLDPHTGEIKAMVGGRDYGNSQYNRITEAFRQPGSIFKPFVYATAFETAFNPLIAPVEEPAESAAAILLDGFGFGLNSDLAEAAEVATVAEITEVIVDEETESTDIDEAVETDERPVLTQAEYFMLREAPEDDETADGLLEEMDFIVLPDREELGSIGKASIITPLATVMDEPTLFFYEDDKFYEPNNYKSVFFGMIPVREALQRSLNVPTVKVAERVGFDRIAELAHRVGLNTDILPYPSIALGSFEVTPIEMAGAYTALANEGVRVEPRALRQVADKDGMITKTYALESEQVFRPELAYLMTNLLENVINRGTGAGVRARGFTLPAAGKTGTSRDGWFAGYTKDLLAIAWVGFDDNRELDLEGSRSALPIWTAFMLAADALYPVREDEETAFYDPPGVELVSIDADTLSLATPYCDNRFTQAFIFGTAPRTYCPIHSFSTGFILSETAAPASANPGLPSATEFPGPIQTPPIENATPATFVP